MRRPRCCTSRNSRRSRSRDVRASFTPLLLRRLRSEALPPLGAPTLDDLAPARALHPLAEPVRPVPALLLRLISPLHGAANSPIAPCMSRNHHPIAPRVLASKTPRGGHEKSSSLR